MLTSQLYNAKPIALRWYQEEAIDSIFDYFNGGGKGNPVIALPTGTGKTLVIAGFAERVLRQWPTQRILVLTHVKELIEQNYAKFKELWPTANAGINSAGIGRRDFEHSIIYGGIGSVANTAHNFGHIDLVIIDECHRVNPKEGTQYHDFLRALKLRNPYLKVIGLSATIYRQGMGYITEDGLFTDVIYNATTPEFFQRFIAEGFLAPLHTKATKFEIDTSGVQITRGEFNQRQLQEAVNVSANVAEGLREFVTYAYQRQSWLIFASGIEHADAMADVLTGWGYPVAALHNKTGKKKREALIEAHKSGELRGLINQNILTTGYDNPQIDTIGVFRPTRSTALWVQMLGRGTRPSPDTGKNECLVLDFARNTASLGPIDDPRIPGKKNPQPGEMPVKICPECDMYNALVATECAYCGAEFPRQEKITKEASALPVMTQAEPPVVEWFEIDSVYYSKHDKKFPPSMRVDYLCGLRRFSEWIALEKSTGRGLAKRFWQQRCTVDMELPETVDVALRWTGKLATPKRVKVWTNRKVNGTEMPQVLGVEM
jgi:DNA repair protein RadD